MDEDELIRKFRDAALSAAQPVDFDGLIVQGVLSKEGKGGWYRVHKPDLLPEHASVEEVAQDSRGMKIKFRNTRSSTRRTGR